MLTQYAFSILFIDKKKAKFSNDRFGIKDKRDPDWAYSWVPVLGPVLGGTVAGLCGIWLMSL